MIDSLFSLLWPLTLLLALLLLCHQWLLNTLGAKLSYIIWLLVPLSLACYLLPIPWHHSNTALVNMQRYIVKPSEQLLPEVQNWILICWLLGAVLISAIWFISHFRFSSRLNLTPLAHGQVNVPLPKKLSIFQSEMAYSPMLLGLVKPKLIIPENFTETFNVTQQTLIVEHEICHFDRNDIYWNCLALSCVALFWFHPLIWLAYFKFRQDQELSCDQIVLARKQTEIRIEYSKALLVVAEFAPPMAFAQLSFKKYGDKQMMFERIKQIKANTQASKLALSTAIILSISLLSGLSYASNTNNQTGNTTERFRTPPKGMVGVKPIYRVEPKYPLQAVQQKIEGSVILKFDINRAGQVFNVEVVNGKPAYVFDKVAKTALEQWQYEASNNIHKNNLVQLDFQLDNSNKPAELVERIKVSH